MMAGEQFQTEPSVHLPDINSVNPPKKDLLTDRALHNVHISALH